MQVIRERHEQKRCSTDIRLLRYALALIIGCLWAGLLCTGCQVEEDTKDTRRKPKSARSTAEKIDKNAVRVLFAYGSEKEDWIKDVTRAFHAAKHKTSDGTTIHIDARPMGSGESMDAILSGRLKAHVASPASAAFIKLANAESKQKTGNDLIGATQNLVMSPVVIAMWKPMAEAIGWGQKPIGWSDIIALSKDPKGWETYGKPQWGKLKFGHTHPKFSNSGLISLFAEVYAGADKVAGLTVEDVKKPEVGEYLTQIERAVVHYGSSTGFFGKKMFRNGPEYLSAAVLYENMIIESYDPAYNLPFPVVAIYPKEGTFWSDHPAGIVQREWVTPQHKEAAEKYLAYLLEAEQQKKALQYGFRPAVVDIPLGAPIDKAHGVDPKEPQTTLEVPSVPVMDAILELWKENKKHSDVVLVLDVSGSMKKGGKMAKAKEGARALIDMMGDEDRFSLIAFNQTAVWALKDVLLKNGRQDALGQINSLFPQGGTALYDAIAMAHKHLSAKPPEDRILAVAALTDGQDNKSTLPMQQLINLIEVSPEKNNIRVFTIGYGQGANKQVLHNIAEKTQVKSYQGTPENIHKVFRDISTFF